MLFEGSAIDSIGGAEAMLEGSAGANVSQLGLDHSAQIAGSMMSEVKDFARLAFENDNHTAPNLSCRNCHKLKSPLRKVGC